MYIPNKNKVLSPLDNDKCRKNNQFQNFLSSANAGTADSRQQTADRGASEQLVLL